MKNSQQIINKKEIEENRKEMPKNYKIKSIIIGIAVGIVNGFFGGGGGMIVVPGLNKILNQKTKCAHATAILIILPISIASGIVYSAFGGFDLNIGLPVTLGVIVGGVVGAFLLKKLPPSWVTYTFSVIMLAGGIKMLFF